jgi:hypothetical protein
MGDCAACGRRAQQMLAFSRAVAGNLRRPCTHPRCASLRMLSTAQLQAAAAATAPINSDTSSTASCRALNTSTARARAAQSDHNKHHFNQRMLKRPRSGIKGAANNRPGNYSHARHAAPLSETGLHRKGLATVIRLLRYELRTMTVLFDCCVYY